MSSLAQKFTAITTFSIAMGFLEAATVVYLRALYYPEGFSFPLKTIPIDILLVEIGREISTIVMLAFIGSIAGKTLLEKFCYFTYSFGIWDIFYYVWLKLISNWPPSLSTWDLLFLVPVPWVGPILAPLIVALTMTIVAAVIIYLQGKGIYLKISKLDLMLGAFAALLIFASFVMDFPRMAAQQTPIKYHWEFLICGEFLGLFVTFRILFLK
ncbi:MAG: hypothetical protein E3J56_01825 [Candidatus Aminicenantes bacterium]|nr:MAG: hypothetical protein E3J56_01825 [Candidatus Aminicenantes bacterium]